MQSVFSFRVWNKLLADDSLLDTLGYDGWGAAERLSKNKKIMQSFSSRAENEHNRPYYPLIPQNCRYPCSIVVLQYSCIKLLFLCKFISINEQLFSPVISILLSLCVCECEWVRFHMTLCIMLNPAGWWWEWDLEWLHAGSFRKHTSPVSVLGFYSTVALLSQGHETPAPPGVSSCICEELLGSAWVLATDLCFFLCLVLLSLTLT